MVYLVVKDPDDIGVYEFVSRGVAEKTAKIFKQAAVLESYEKEKAMSIVNASEVIDATFLIRKYKNSNISTAKTDKEKAKNTPAPTEIKSNFVTLINKMKDIKNNSVRIEMINGDEFYLALKSLFYITKPEYINIESPHPKPRYIKIIPIGLSSLKTFAIFAIVNITI